MLAYNIYGNNLEVDTLINLAYNLITINFNSFFMTSSLNIKNYIDDGFTKVCDVVLLQDGNWVYTNVNESVMFKDHRSWIYFIVVDDVIVKVGETGNPLGIKSSSTFRGWYQPKSGSTNRFGRYRNGDNTDAYIRKSLWNEAVNGLVSLWARECPLLETEVSIQGLKKNTQISMHKHLEIDILKLMLENKCWPRLNKSMK